MHVQQIIPRIKIANQSPILEMVEDDQAFPAGMWRWRVQDDIAILERATNTFWTADEDWVAYDKGNEVMRFIKAIATQDGGELTIAVGVITATVTKHTVDTEADAATDQLDTINGAGYVGQLLILGSEDDARDIILRDYNDSGGNIACGGAGATVVLQNVVDRVMLQWDGTYWCVIADSISNAASSSSTLSVAAVDSLNPGRADYQCDGTADEVEINAALAALPAQGGRIILLEGTFTIVDSITIPDDDIVLEGQGRSTFIDGDGLATTEHGIVISAHTNVIIKNLAIQTQDGGAKTCHCIFVEDGANYTTIECVIIVDSDSDGIHFEGTGTLYCIIRNCLILDADDYGIAVSMDPANSASDFAISENTVIGAGNDGIYICLALYTIVSGNNCTGNGNHGIYLLRSDYCELSGNSCVSNGADGINVTGDGTRNSDYNTLTGNACTGNTDDGIAVEGTTDANHNIVISNQLVGNTGTNLVNNGANTDLGHNKT